MGINDSILKSKEIAEEYGVVSAGNALVSEASGKSTSFELTPYGIYYIKDDNGINVHTNHSLNSETAKKEISEYKASVGRYNILKDLLNKEKGSLILERCMYFFSDHSIYPDGICVHDIEGKDKFTSAAVVSQPLKGKMLAVHGNPCENSAKIYEL